MRSNRRDSLRKLNPPALDSNEGVTPCTKENHTSKATIAVWKKGRYSSAGMVGKRFFE